MCRKEIQRSSKMKQMHTIRSFNNLKLQYQGVIFFIFKLFLDVKSRLPVINAISVNSSAAVPARSTRGQLVAF
jgi:hypothetical protein